MRTLRIAGLLVGLALIAWELWRGWGAGVPVFEWLDNPVAGALLMAASVALSKDTTRRRAFFVAAWSLIAGLNYNALVTKLSAPDVVAAGNVSVGQVTLITGFVFVLSVACAIAAALHPRIR